MTIYKKSINLEGKNKFQRQATVIKEIAIGTTMAVLQDEKVYALAATVGLYQGLKYNGSFKRGANAGIATMGVLIGANIVRSIAVNIEVIKEV